MSYNGLGDITGKQAYTSTGSSDGHATTTGYSYSAGTHRLTSTSVGSVTYNGNGSMLASDGRTMGWSVFNKPTSIVKSADKSVHLYYGPNRQRYQRIDAINTSSETTTHYVGDLEMIWRPGNIIEAKRYLDGELVVTHTDDNGTLTTQEHYLLKDHLGSTDMITDDTGAPVQAMSFDAFGMRRSAVDFNTLPPSPVFDTGITTRGFTGHEGLDGVGLVHMNGRVYDPRLGRFISADPFVQAPNNTQSLNRYAYVWNNPLRYNDPSGHFVFSLAAAIKIALTEGITWYTAAAWAGAAGVADALVQGASLRDALQYGAIAGATAGAFVQIGTGIPGTWSEAAARGLKYGLVGGIGSVLQGGKFGHGFVSAGASPIIGRGFAGALGQSLGKEGTMIAQIVVAGGISEATGGKFANGAAYAAFSMAVEGVAGKVDRDHVKGHAPKDGTKIPNDELAAALEVAYEAVYEEVYGGSGFLTEDEAAWYLHDKLYEISVEHGIEFGARIYRTESGGRWHISRPYSQGVSNRIWHIDPPQGALGGIAGAWHSHPSGNPPNTWDFNSVFASDRRPLRSFVSHSYEGRPALSGAGSSSRRFERLNR